MEYKFLSGISSPDDVKKIPQNLLGELCKEIRHCLVETVSKNGGHLASNLGVVELTVALHRIFNSCNDCIIFDVGHQSYTHKLLTGRYGEFSTIRQKDGLSGFMRPSESEHDPFVTGHSSNSISAAYGIYKAKSILGQDGYCISIVGDGALTGGMAFEALNNAGASKSNFIVILNDNKMSISKNIGALARHLNKIRINPSYHRFKYRLKSFLDKLPSFIGNPTFKLLDKSKDLFKDALYHTNFFESLGFEYIGPVDGHDINMLQKAFSIAKLQTKPAFIHVITKKGKGFAPAEENPDIYHGVSSFNITQGANVSLKDTFSSIAGKILCDLAENNKDICAVTAAMQENTGLSDFAKKYPNRFFDVGIAEEHAVTFCGGLAAGGAKPVFAVFSTFLQRGYDQLIHDISINSENVLFLVDRAGVVGEDGVTHQGVYDVSYLTSVSGMTVYSPSNYRELEKNIKTCLAINKPTAVRYPRGDENDTLSDFVPSNNDFDLFGNNNENLIITYGRLFSFAFDAMNKTNKFSVLKLNKIFPVNNEIYNVIKDYKNVHFFEEGIRSGGIAEKVGAVIAENNFGINFKIHAIDDGRVPCASVSVALNELGLDGNAMQNLF